MMIAETAPAAHPSVVEIRYESPKRAASRIVREDDRAWWVACEGACGREITVSKMQLRAADPTNFSPDADQIEVRMTAPGRRTCAFCR